MTTASKRARCGLGVALLLLAAAATANNNPQYVQDEHARATHNYVQWMQAQNSAVYVASAEEIAAGQVEAAMRLEQQQQIRDDAKRDWWGTVVVNTQDGSWSVQLNEHTKDAASVKAIRACKGICSPVLSFANSCMAPAYSAQGGMYWHPGETREAANVAAVQACQAAGGKDCQSPPAQAFCTGWKYAYSTAQRLGHRLSLIAINRVADPKLEEFPGAKEYIAKPFERRGTSTSVGASQHRDAPPADDEEARQRAEGVDRLALQWLAIATGSGNDAYGAHWGLSERDAGDTAVTKCGGGDCKVLVVVPYGECAVAVRGPGAKGGLASFGGRGKTADEAEEAAVTACVSSGARMCPVVFKDCLRKK